MTTHVPCQLLGKDDGIAEELWDTVQQRYHKDNMAHMIALEN